MAVNHWIERGTGERDGARSDDTCHYHWLASVQMYALKIHIWPWWMVSRTCAKRAGYVMRISYQMYSFGWVRCLSRSGCEDDYFWSSITDKENLCLWHKQVVDFKNIMYFVCWSWWLLWSWPFRRPNEAIYEERILKEHHIHLDGQKDKVKMAVNIKI